MKQDLTLKVGVDFSEKEAEQAFNGLIKDLQNRSKDVDLSGDKELEKKFANVLKTAEQIQETLSKAKLGDSINLAPLTSAISDLKESGFNINDILQNINNTFSQLPGIIQAVVSSVNQAQEALTGISKDFGDFDEPHTYKIKVDADLTDFNKNIKAASSQGGKLLKGVTINADVDTERGTKALEDYKNAYNDYINSVKALKSAATSGENVDTTGIYKALDALTKSGEKYKEVLSGTDKVTNYFQKNFDKIIPSLENVSEGIVTTTNNVKNLTSGGGGNGGGELISTEEQLKEVLNLMTQIQQAVSTISGATSKVDFSSLAQNIQKSVDALHEINSKTIDPKQSFETVGEDAEKQINLVSIKLGKAVQQAKDNILSIGESFTTLAENANNSLKGIGEIGKATSDVPQMISKLASNFGSLDLNFKDYASYIGTITRSMKVLSDENFKATGFQNATDNVKLLNTLLTESVESISKARQEQEALNTAEKDKSPVATIKEIIDAYGQFAESFSDLTAKIGELNKSVSDPRYELTGLNKLYRNITSINTALTETKSSLAEVTGYVPNKGSGDKDKDKSSEEIAKANANEANVETTKTGKIKYSQEELNEYQKAIADLQKAINDKKAEITQSVTNIGKAFDESGDSIKSHIRNLNDYINTTFGTQTGKSSFAGFASETKKLADNAKTVKEAFSLLSNAADQETQDALNSEFSVLTTKIAELNAQFASNDSLQKNLTTVSSLLRGVGNASKTAGGFSSVLVTLNGLVGFAEKAPLLKDASKAINDFISGLPTDVSNVKALNDQLQPLSRNYKEIAQSLNSITGGDVTKEGNKEAIYIKDLSNTQKTITDSLGAISITIKTWQDSVVESLNKLADIIKDETTKYVSTAIKEARESLNAVIKEDIGDSGSGDDNSNSASTQPSGSSFIVDKNKIRKRVIVKSNKNQDTETKSVDETAKASAEAEKEFSDKLDSTTSSISEWKDAILKQLTDLQSQITTIVENINTSFAKAKDTLENQKQLEDVTKSDNNNSASIEVKSDALIGAANELKNSLDALNVTIVNTQSAINNISGTGSSSAGNSSDIDFEQSTINQYMKSIDDYNTKIINMRQEITKLLDSRSLTSNAKDSLKGLLQMLVEAQKSIDGVGKDGKQTAEQLKTVTDNLAVSLDGVNDKYTEITTNIGNKKENKYGVLDTTLNGNGSLVEQSTNYIKKNTGTGVSSIDWKPISSGVQQYTRLVTDANKVTTKHVYTIDAENKQLREHTEVISTVINAYKETSTLADKIVSESERLTSGIKSAVDSKEYTSSANKELGTLQNKLKGITDDINNFDKEGIHDKDEVLSFLTSLQKRLKAVDDEYKDITKDSTTNSYKKVNALGTVANGTYTKSTATDYLSRKYGAQIDSSNWVGSRNRAKSGIESLSLIAKDSKGKYQQINATLNTTTGELREQKIAIDSVRDAYQVMFDQVEDGNQDAQKTIEDLNNKVNGGVLTKDSSELIDKAKSKIDDAYKALNDYVKSDVVEQGTLNKLYRDFIDSLNEANKLSSQLNKSSQSNPYLQSNKYGSVVNLGNGTDSQFTQQAAEQYLSDYLDNHNATQVNKYGNTWKDIGTTSANPIKQLTTYYKDAGDQVHKFTLTLDESNNALRETDEIASKSGNAFSIFDSLGGKMSKTYQSEMDTLNKDLAQIVVLRKEIANGNLIEETGPVLDEVEKKLISIKDNLTKVGTEGENTTEEIKQAISSASSAEEFNKKELNRIGNMGSVNNPYLRTNEFGTAVNGSYTRDQAVEYLKSLSSGLATYRASGWSTNSQGLEEFTLTAKDASGAYKDFVAVLDESNGVLRTQTKDAAESVTIIDRLADGIKRTSDYFMQYIGMYLSVREAFQLLQQGFQYAKELDSALTELKLVTGSTSEQMSDFAKQAKSAADEVAGLTTEVVQSATDWSRLGYSMSDSLDLATESAKLAKVGFMETSEATEQLTASLQAFYGKDITNGFISAGDAAKQVSDILVQVGNNLPITSAGLGESLMESAGSLVAAGNSVQQSAAMLAAANATIQNPKIVGNAMKTISMRLRGKNTTEVSNELGEDVTADFADSAQSISKLYTEIKKLTAVKENDFKGISILTDTGEYRSTYDILKDIAGVWDKLSDMNQSVLLEDIAGKRQGSIVASLFQNPDLLQKAFDNATNASGAADKAMETAMDSIDAKVNQLKNSWESLWQDFIQSDDVKNAVRLLTNLVNVLDKLISGTSKFGGTLTNIVGLVSVFANLEQRIRGGGLDYEGGLVNINHNRTTGKNEFRILGQQIGGKKSTSTTYNPIDMGGGVQMSSSAVSAVSSLIKNGGDTSLENLTKVIANVGDTSEDTAKIIATDLTDSFSKSSDAAQKWADSLSTSTVAAGGFKASLGDIGGTLASFGTSLLSGFISTAVTMLITTLLQKAFNAINDYIHRYDNMVDNANESYSNVQKSEDTFKGNIESIEQLRDEYDKLSAGVNANGNNVSLTADEYERYNEILSQLTGYNDQLDDQYKLQNSDLKDQAGLIDKLIEAQKRQMAANIANVVNNKDNDYFNYAKGIEGQAQKTLYNNLGDYYSDAGMSVGTSGKITQSSFTKLAINQLFKNYSKNYDPKKQIAEQADEINAELEKALVDNGISFSGKVDINNDTFMKENAKAINEAGAEIARSFSGMGDAADITGDKTIDAMSKASKAISTYDDTVSGAEEEQKNRINAALNGVEKYALATEDQQEIIKHLIDNSNNYEDMFTGDDPQKIMSNLDDAVNGILQGFDKANIKLDKAKENAKDLIDNSSWVDAVKGVDKQVNQILNAAGEEYNNDANRNALKLYFGIQTEDGTDVTTPQKMADYLTNLIGKSEKGWINSLSLDDLETYYKTATKYMSAGITPDKQTLVEAQQAIAAYNQVMNHTIDAYSDVQTAVSTYTSSMQSLDHEFVNDQKLTDDEYTAIQDVVDANADLTDVIEETTDAESGNTEYVVKNAKALGDLINQSNKTTKAMQSVEKAQGAVNKSYTETIAQIGNLIDDQGKFTDSLKASDLLEYANQLQHLTENYAMLQMQLQGDTKAFDDFKTAQTTDSEYTYDSDLVTMMNTAYSAYTNNEFGTASYQAAQSALLPDSVVKKTQDNVDKIDATYKHLSDLAKKGIITTKTEDGLTTVEDLTYDNAKAFVQAALDAKVFEGTLSDFRLNTSQVSSLYDVANALGMSESEVIGLSEAVQKFSVNGTNPLSDLYQNADSDIMDWIESAHEAEQTLYDLQNSSPETKQLDSYQKKVQECVNTIKESKEQLAQFGVNSVVNMQDMMNLDDQITEAQNKVDELQDKANSDSSYNDDLATAQAQLDTLIEQKQTLAEPTELSVTVATDTIDSDMDELQKQIDNYHNGKGLSSTIHLQTADIQRGAGESDEDYLQDIIDYYNELNGTRKEIVQNYGTDEQQLHDTFGDILEDLDKISDALDDDSEYNITVNDDAFKTKLKQMRTAWTALKNFIQAPIKVSAPTTTNSSDLDFRYGSSKATKNATKKKGTNAANGTPSAKGGKTLVGEEGRELVVDRYGGTYQTVGDNGAEFVDLPKDAIVFDHKQTEQLLSTGHTTRGQALAGGNAYDKGHATIKRKPVKNIPQPSSETSNTTNNDITSYGTSNGTYETSAYKKAQAAKATEEVKKAAKDAEDAADEAEQKFEDELEKAFEALKKKLDDGDIAVDEYLSQATTLYEKYNKQAQSLGQDATDALKSQWTGAFDDLTGTLDDQLSNGEISVNDYLDKLDKATTTFYRNQKGYAKELKDAEKKYIDEVKNALDDAVSAASTIIGNRISEIEDLQSKATDALSEQQDKIDREYELKERPLNQQIQAYSDEIAAINKENQARDDQIYVLEQMQKPLNKQIAAYQKEQEAIQDLEKPLQDQIDAQNEIIDGINDQIDAVNDQIDSYSKKQKALQKTIDGYQDEMDAIDKENEKRQTAIDLQKAQYEMERARHQRTQYVYTQDKGFVYRADPQAIKDAQQDLDEKTISKQKQEIQNKIDLIQKQVDAYQDEIDKRNEVIESYNDEIKKHQDIVDGLQKQINAYEKQSDAIQDQIDLVQKEVNKYQEQIDAIQEISDQRSHDADMIQRESDAVQDQIDKMERAKSAIDQYYSDATYNVEQYYKPLLDQLNNVAQMYEKVKSAQEEAQAASSLATFGLDENSIISDPSGSLQKLLGVYQQVWAELYQNNPQMLDALNKEFESLGINLNGITPSIDSIKNSMQGLGVESGTTTEQLGRFNDQIMTIGNAPVTATDTYLGLMSAVSKAIQDTGVNIDNLKTSTANLYYQLDPSVLTAYATAYQQLVTQANSATASTQEVTNAQQALNNLLTPDQLTNYVAYVNGLSGSMDITTQKIDMASTSANALNTNMTGLGGSTQTLLNISSMLGSALNEASSGLGALNGNAITGDDVLKNMGIDTSTLTNNLSGLDVTASGLGTTASNAAVGVDALNSSASNLNSTSATNATQQLADSLTQISATDLTGSSTQLSTLATNAYQMHLLNAELVQMQWTLQGMVGSDLYGQALTKFQDYVANFETLATQFSNDLKGIFGTGGTDKANNDSASSSWFDGFVDGVEDMNKRTSEALENQVKIWGDFQALMTGVIGSDGSDGTAASSTSIIGSLTAGASDMNKAFGDWADVMDRFVYGNDGFQKYTTGVYELVQEMVKDVTGVCNNAEMYLSTYDTNVSTHMESISSSVSTAAAEIEQSVSDLKTAITQANQAISSSSVSSFGGFAFAKGSQGVSKNQVALVGENGPEMVVSPKDGTYSIVGQTGPQLTKLKSGDVVYTAEQTKGIIDGNGVKSGRAYAKGTIDDATFNDLNHELYLSRVNLGRVQSQVDKYTNTINEQNEEIESLNIQVADLQNANEMANNALLNVRAEFANFAEDAENKNMMQAQQIDELQSQIQTISTSDGTYQKVTADNYDGIVGALYNCGKDLLGEFSSKFSDLTRNMASTVSNSSVLNNNTNDSTRTMTINKLTVSFPNESVSDASGLLKDLQSLPNKIYQSTHSFA